MTRTFVFQRFAGSRQLRIQSFEDLLRVRELPEALWLATACPTQGLHCAQRFLDFMDVDRNGRIRARELCSAITWLDEMLEDPRDAVPGHDVLRLVHLSEKAASLRAAAELVLQNLEAADRTQISLQQVQQTTEIFRKVTSNGDGIISPDGIEEPGAKAAAIAILESFPGATDKSGERGVDPATLESFENARIKAIDWLDRGRTLDSLGEDTIERASIVRDVATRIDEYFLECRVVASHPEAARRLLAPLDAAIDKREALARVLDTLPIAAPDPHGVLDFTRLFRGAVFEKIERLRDRVLRPVLGESSATLLSEDAWKTLYERARPVLDWQDEKSAHPLLALGEARLRSIRAEDLARIRELCAQDLRFGETLARLDELEKLILYQRWLFTFANNLVSMPHLYHQGQRALFEQGTLILAGREFTLAIRVPDRAEHAELASDAGMYMMYLEVYGGMPEQRFEVAVPVTSGTSDNLWVGKNGIFRTIDGEELDARIVQLVVSPVSLFEALTLPFAKLGQILGKRLERLSSRLDEDLAKIGKAAPAPSLARPIAPIAPAAPVPMAGAPAVAPGGFSSMLFGGSVAFAAIGSALAFITGQLQKMISESPLTLLYAFLVIVTVLIGPIVLWAWIRLRRRNLATVLEGAGWALNDRLRLTRRLGKIYTRKPRPPVGTKTELRDKVRRQNSSSVIMP